jgi:hypothetical protein
MPTITKRRYQDTQNFGNSPWGNVMALEYTLATASNGSVIGGDSASAVASGDVVRLGLLPAGFRVHDVLVIVDDAFTASVIADVGFAYEDGVDDATAPQGASAYANDLAVNTVGRYRSNVASKLATLQKPAWLTVTTAGAAHNTAASATVIVYGEFVGV